MNLLQLIRPFLVYILFQAGRLVFSSVVSIWWFLNGTYKRDRQRALPDNYQMSAHVLDILMRYKIDTIMQPTERKCFWLTHNHFAHPDTVLRDNVSLWNITDDEAVFVETDETVDVALMETSGFVSVSQYLHAKRIITMPLSSFHRLGESVGDPKGELIFVSSVGRCGSTLLNQFFEETGHCRCYSEHEGFNYLSFACMKDGEEEKLKELLTSCVRLLCKPRVDRDYIGYVFKIRPINSFASIPLVMHVFPESHCLFMYREVLPVAQSTTKATRNMPFWQMRVITANVSSPICRYFLRWMFHPTNEEPWWTPATPLVKNAWMWVWACFKYQELRSQGVAIRAIKYEDLLEKPNQTARNILRYVGLPEDWAEDGLRALNKDSQRNSPLSREELARHRPTQITAAEKRTVDALAAKYGVPMKWNDCLLEGTLTP